MWSSLYLHIERSFIPFPGSWLSWNIFGRENSFDGSECSYIVYASDTDNVLCPYCLRVVCKWLFCLRSCWYNIKLDVHFFKILVVLHGAVSTLSHDLVSISNGTWNWALLSVLLLEATYAASSFFSAVMVNAGTGWSVLCLLNANGLWRHHIERCSAHKRLIINICKILLLCDVTRVVLICWRLSKLAKFEAINSISLFQSCGQICIWINVFVQWILSGCCHLEVPSTKWGFVRTLLRHL